MTVRRLALLLLLAAAGPALAQQGTTTDQPKNAATTPPKLPFTFYGTLNVNLQWTEAMGATNSAADVKPRTSVSIDSSNLGVRGSVDVREWLQVVYQCESGATVDGVFSSTFSICNRNSRLGLASAKYGTLFYGNWDTPYKAQAYGTKADDPFLNTDVYGMASLLSSPGFNYRSGGWSTSSNSTIIGFDVRASNSVGYQSPRWSGVSFKLQYAVDEFKNPSGTQDPRLYSAVVNYDSGPLSASAAWERHDDGFALVGINPAAAAPGTGSANSTFGATAGNTAGSATAAAHSTDTAWRLAAGYGQAWGSAGETTVSAMVEGLMLDQKKQPAGAVKRFQRVAWQLGAKHRIGDHELRARFSMANRGSCKLEGGAACSTSGYGAWDLALGYAYYLLPTLQGYVFYTRIENERRAQYTFTVGGSPAVAGATPAGADPQALGLGLRYTF